MRSSKTDTKHLRAPKFSTDFNRGVHAVPSMTPTIQPSKFTGLSSRRNKSSYAYVVYKEPVQMILLDRLMSCHTLTHLDIIKANRDHITQQAKYCFLHVLLIGLYIRDSLEFCTFSKKFIPIFITQHCTSTVPSCTFTWQMCYLLNTLLCSNPVTVISLLTRN